LTRGPCGPAEPARAPQARVGGRSARVVADVLRTTLEIIGENGFAGLRVEDVAARAAVNKTTIYRRWPTRGDLLIAALTSLSTQPASAETGRLEFHHRTPYARGGPTDVGNVTLRCRTHNAFEGRLAFGEPHRRRTVTSG
jgi:AcrR family transcriptional regulator